MTREREELVECINQGMVKVIFRKIDGTERTMMCTRCFDYIPPDHRPIGGRETRKNNPALEYVYDLEKEDWRCFVYENVIEWSSKQSKDGKEFTITELKGETNGT